MNKNLYFTTFIITKLPKGVLTAILNPENSGNSFYNYIQGLIKITDITYLSREKVRSTFWEDFKIFISEHTPKNRIEKIISKQLNIHKLTETTAAHNNTYPKGGV